MATPYGIDMGNVLRTVEGVKDSRQNREHRNTLMGWKTEDREAAKQRTRSLNVLREKAKSGDQQSMRELMAFDPEEGKALYDGLNQMDEDQRAIAKDNVNTMGRIAAYVLRAEDPQKALDIALSNLPPELAEKMPKEYDENSMHMVLARAAEMSDMLENPEKVQFGDKDQLYQNGFLQGERNTPAKTTGKGSGSGGGLKSTDESLMFRMSAELLGGIFDQQGNLQNLDPEQRANVQAITTEAARLRTTGEAGTAGQAVTLAARKLGIKVSNLGAGGTIDRNNLLTLYSQPQ